MPINATLKPPPCGFSTESIQGPGQVTIQTMGFNSSEDGALFTQRLEQLVELILSQCTDASPAPGIPRSQIDNFLAVIDRTGHATIYINETPYKISVRTTKSSVKKYELLIKDDILEVCDFDLDDFNIPNDAGVVFLFSQGWRKGLFYDLSPIGKQAVTRNYDLSRMFGSCFGRVIFQERFQISEHGWNEFLQQGWFPFTGLRAKQLEEIIHFAENGWNIDKCIDTIQSDLRERVSRLVEMWERHKLFTNHIPGIKIGIERYLAEDYISAVSVLIPRIEGLMRKHHRLLFPDQKPNQFSMSKSAINFRASDHFCVFLPAAFSRFLREVYFKSFEDSDEEIDVSRHSVAHGMASDSAHSAKECITAILTIHQLFCCFSPSQ